MADTYCGPGGWRSQVSHVKFTSDIDRLTANSLAHSCKPATLQGMVSRCISLVLTLSVVLAGVNGLAGSVALVNPLIGTAGGGQTYPAAGVPFGMTQWVPQTRDGENKCVAPYYFADHKIQGFRGSHFPSGSCTQDYGSVTVMPISGKLRLGAEERASSFSHQEEETSPDRYAVTLNDYQIRAELTGASHSGIMRFVFGRPGRSWILIQSNSKDGDGTVTIDLPRHEIIGHNPVRRLYAGRGKLAGFSGYFVIQFDRPFVMGGTWSGSIRHDGATRQDAVNGAPGAYVGFDLKSGEAAQVKIGMSFTSLDEARRNLQAEIPGWNFHDVEKQAQAKWNAILQTFQIDVPDLARQKIFYTALYHAFLMPREFSDVNGTYPRFAGSDRIETARNFVYYDDFSLWDTFRAVHPLFTLLAPRRDLDMVKSLIVKGEEGGFLPIYPAWNSYTSEMVGDHADAVIADAYFKGIQGFNLQEAYRLMRQNATELPKSRAEYEDGKGRRGLDAYLKYGYIPLEDTLSGANPTHPNEQVTRTLEYAYDDFLVGKVAQALGKNEDASMFAARARNYLNVIDPAVGFARGRHQNGAWDSPFDPAGHYSYITEGLPYQDTFFVPQDVDGLIALLGGPSLFVSKLDGLFAGGYYDQGNEPSHGIAYLYDYAGAAWKTQKHVREILDTQYSDRSDGLPGNDDCGQISAWYIFSALGFYPETPGLPEYRIGTPLFNTIRMHLPNGKIFEVDAAGAAEGKQYIQSLTFNGRSLERPWLTHKEIVSGGKLVFKMSAQPNPNWPPNVP